MLNSHSLMIALGEGNEGKVEGIAHLLKIAHESTSSINYNDGTKAKAKKKFHKVFR